VNKPQDLRGVGELIVGGVENPDITFVTEAEVWVGIAEGRLDPMRQFMSGKLKVKGDMMRLIHSLPQVRPD
jgi:hypothetical protein